MRLHSRRHRRCRRRLRRRLRRCPTQRRRRYSLRRRRMPMTAAQPASRRRSVVMAAATTPVAAPRTSRRCGVVMAAASTRLEARQQGPPPRTNSSTRRGRHFLGDLRLPRPQVRGRPRGSPRRPSSMWALAAPPRQSPPQWGHGACECNRACRLQARGCCPNALPGLSARSAWPERRQPPRANECSVSLLPSWWLRNRHSWRHGTRSHRSAWFPRRATWRRAPPF
mmetsp:Transcript_86866/g.176872  ORF Transcript_86866/g.176872 Transcript_86866/m.176872 type:complete len:225 (-) Transcript_86866:76-750(-)